MQVEGRWGGGFVGSVGARVVVGVVCRWAYFYYYVRSAVSASASAR